MKSWVHIH